MKNPTSKPTNVRRAVSAKVARQMLWLLGDNANWTEPAEGADLKVWADLSAARKAGPVEFEELAQLYPEQAAALVSGVKQWGLDWLRGVVEADRNLDQVALTAAARRAS